jgi:transcriptional regulator with XRE-family HTH domain
MAMRLDVKGAILKSGRRQYEIAQELGIPKSSLSKYIRGYGPLSHSYASKLAKLIRLSLEGGAGDEPDTPQAYGWRQVTLGTGPCVNTTCQPQGRCVGWFDGKNVYLEPEASYAEAQALARVQGDALSVSSQTLRKRLHERLVLVSTDESRQTLTVRHKHVEQQRSVFLVHIQPLSVG